MSATVLAYKLADCGYVMHVAVAPEARRRGVGRALMHRLAEHLRAEGCARWSLYVKTDNAAAIALYEESGMRIDVPVATMSMRWQSVRAFDAAADVVVEAFEANEDRSVEDALGIDRGRVTRQRGLARVMARARVGDEVVGLIAFDVELAKAFLFRARSAPIARALFEHAQPAGGEAREDFQVVLESDEPLARALLEAGGARVESMWRMAGRLPGVEG